MQTHRSRKPEGRHGKDRHDAQPGRRSRAEEADTPRGHRPPGWSVNAFLDKFYKDKPASRNSTGLI